MIKEFDNINGEFSVCDTQARNNVDDLKNVIKGVSLSIDFFPKEEADTSDSERIQRGIDFLHNTTSGGTLMFTAQDFTIDKTLILYDNIELHGMSASSTTFIVTSNISFCRIYDKTSRHDNIVLKDFKVTRQADNCNTVLLDFESIAWSKLINLNVYQENSQQMNEGVIGLQFSTLSYYNTVQSCTFRYFNIGISCVNKANGNVFLGGSCISCYKYGVYINRTNSQRFFGHSVELVAQYAYFLENRSLTNLFCGCRVEGTDKSFHAQFEANSNSSIQNLLVCCLDYSSNGEEWSATNFNVSASNLLIMKNRNDVPCFMATHNFGQGSFTQGTFKQLMTTKVLQNRGNALSVSENYASFTAPVTGSYKFDIGIVCTNAQTGGVNIGLYKNGSIASNHLEYHGSNQNNFNSEFTIYLTAGDIITAWVNPSVTTNISGNANTYFSGVLL